MLLCGILKNGTNEPINISKNIELQMYKTNMVFKGNGGRKNWEIGIDIYTLLYNRYGEGNGTPLQYSCLENPMGGGAW